MLLFSAAFFFFFFYQDSICRFRSVLSAYVSRVTAVRKLEIDKTDRERSQTPHNLLSLRF